jgi:lipoprotein-releasing system permease protein
MAGVGLGVLSLVVVISVMNGFNDSIRRRLLAVEPHLVVTVPGISHGDDLETHPLRNLLLSHKEIQTQVFDNQDVIVRTVDGLFGGAIARGVEPGALGYILSETRKALEVSEGRTGSGIEIPPVSDESTHLGPGEVLIGIDLARSLGVFEGDKLTVIQPEALLLPSGEAPHFERVTVKGLLTTNLPDIDDKVIFYGRGATFNSFRDSASREAGFEVRLPDPNHFTDLKNEIQMKGGKVESWMDRNSALFFALRMEKLSIGAVLALASLIASFSIVTVLVLLLTQKRKDIGLLMALGLSPKQTRYLFIRVGMMLSFLGIFGGLISGVIICLLVDHYRLPILPDVYYDATIPAKVDPTFILGILIAAGVVAFYSAWFPARSQTAEMPADSLRSRHQIREEHR